MQFIDLTPQPNDQYIALPEPIWPGLLEETRLRRVREVRGFKNSLYWYFSNSGDLFFEEYLLYRSD